MSALQTQRVVVGWYVLHNSGGGFWKHVDYFHGPGAKADAEKAIRDRVAAGTWEGPLSSYIIEAATEGRL